MECYLLTFLTLFVISQLGEYVKRLFISLMLFAASFAVAGSASAVVVNGSTYSIYLAGEVSENAVLPTSVFDDTPATFVRNGLVVTVSESDTALSATDNLIRLNLSATGDLFPVFDEGAFFGVGTFGDVIDLASSVTLYDARVTVRDLNGGVLFASDNIASFAPNTAPWDGAFPTTATTFRVGEIGGRNASSITFDFYVTAAVQNNVPEPGSVLLSGIGLLAAFGARRQRRTQA